MSNTSEHNCSICNKVYSSYKSLWTHNKNFHNKPVIIKTENQEQEIQNDCILFECRICNKKYKHKQSIYKHEKTCSGTKQTDKEIELEKCKTINLDKEQETEKMKQKTLELQIKLQGMKKMDDKTFKTINKLLRDRSTHNTTNNNTQNVININFPNILSLGKENIPETLSRGEKKFILDSRLMSIDKMVEIVHCGRHNMFKNIVITNLKDKFAYKYDETKGYFITGNKTDLIDDLMTFRMLDLETIYDELSTAKKIDNKTKKFIQDFLDKMENEKPFSYGDVDYPNYKSYKIDSIKILLYNNRDKLTQDIALLIKEKIPIEEEEIPKNEIISTIQET